MIEFIILGFLFLQLPLTSYDLKKAMEHSTEFFASTSLGVIHPTLIKLEKKGFVTSYEETKNNRRRKLFTITEAGKAAFMIEIRKDLGPDKYKSNQLLKMFFFDKLDINEQIESVEAHIQNMINMHQSLMEVKLAAAEQCLRFGVTVESYPPARFQMDTLEFGLDYSKFVSDWFEKYKETLIARQLKGVPNESDTN